MGWMGRCAGVGRMDGDIEAIKTDLVGARRADSHTDLSACWLQGCLPRAALWGPQENLPEAVMGMGHTQGHMVWGPGCCRHEARGQRNV